MLSAQRLQCFARKFPDCYVPLHPIRFSSLSTPAQNRSHGSNVICNGSPSRMRMVRRISLGITTRPRSSMRRTIPVAFMVFLLRSAAVSHGIFFVPTVLSARFGSVFNFSRWFSLEECYGKEARAPAPCPRKYGGTSVSLCRQSRSSTRFTPTSEGNASPSWQIPTAAWEGASWYR